MPTLSDYISIYIYISLEVNYFFTPQLIHWVIRWSLYHCIILYFNGLYLV